MGEGGSSDEGRPSVADINKSACLHLCRWPASVVRLVASPANKFVTKLSFRRPEWKLSRSFPEGAQPISTASPCNKIHAADAEAASDGR